MDDCVWTFARGDERLSIRRQPEGDGLLLVLSGHGPDRSYYFADLVPLVRFQDDMEAFLLQTGWTFAGFAPERRAGRDRRGFPRLDERRRWWTDGPSSGAAAPPRSSRSGRRES